MLNKGLWVDGDNRFVPLGFWNDARNAVIYDEEGNYNLTNEKGYSNYANLPADFTPIGKINFSDGNTILFLSYIGYSTVTPASKIVLIDNYGNLTTILSSDILNFSPLHQIKGTFYVNSHNERIIYWVDGYNSPSYLNIDNFNAATLTAQELSLFYLNIWPQVSLNSIQDNGGSLEAGSYQATIQVLNSNFQPSNYMFVCGPITITNKLSSEANQDINDNYQYDGAQSGFPTTKAITFNVSNLGGDIAYYNLIIIRSVNSVKSYFQTDNIPLSASLSDTTYQLRDTSTLTPVTVNTISQVFSTYGTANVIAQLNNTLLLGDLSQITDLEYQQIANQIKVYYYTEEFNIDDDRNNYKSALGVANFDGSEDLNYNAKSYMRDEVYALGIVWHFDDGTNSYVYHIPGRASIAGRDDGTVTDTIYGTGTPTWKAYNTADTEAAGNTNLLAYWESTELYPNTTEWGALAGTHVRHHKMPNILKSPHYRVVRDGSQNTTEKIGRILRLNITNINLPAIALNRITGYSIVRIQRNESNKSILMQGGLFNFTTHGPGGPPYHVINSFPYSGKTLCTFTDLGSTANIENQFSFYSPEDRFNTVSQVLPDYMQNEYIAYANQNGPTNSDVQIYSGKTLNDRNLFEPAVVNFPLVTAVGPISGLINGVSIYSLADNHAQKKRLVSTITEISNNNGNETLFGPVLINNNGGPSFMAIDTSSLSPIAGNAALVYPEIVLSSDGIATTTSPQFALTAIPSKGQDNSGNIWPDNGGSGRITANNNYGNWAAYYITNLRKLYSAQYNTLDSLVYMYAGATVFLPTQASITAYAALTSGGINSYEVTNSQGDTFITNFYFRRTVRGDSNTFNSNTVNSGLVPGTTTEVKAMNYIPIESMINVALRNSGVDMNPPDSSLTKSYYPKTNIYTGSGGSFMEQPSYVDNFYAYDIDYSSENTVTGYFPKPLNINTSTEFRNRIIYSNKKTDEDVFDAYRQFIVNNYKDMPGEKGRIKDIWIDHNRVYIHMENTLYVIPTDELKLGTTEGTINVGTGAYLEQPPIELKSSEDGYLGLPTAFANVLTPSGYFSIDTRRCEAFMFTGEDNKISEIGLRSFFLSNAPFSIVNQVNAVDINSGITAENGWVPNGIGYSVAFDSKYRRILVYKKDYTLVNPSLYNTSYDTPGNFFYKNGYFYVWSEIEGTQGPDSSSDIYLDSYLRTVTVYSNLLPLDNTSYFKDNSFTLSYSLDTKSWTSFHDYKPMFMYNSLNFYSVPYVTPGTANHVVLHHSNDYGKFGTVYPFIVEATLNRIGNYGQMSNKSGSSPYAENALLTDSTQGHKQTQSILLDTKCTDSNGILQIATFDDVIIYNSYQSSGLVPITNRGTSSYVRGIWNINKFRDLVVNYSSPFFDSAKNPINVSSTKQYTLKKRFTDNYIVTRFIFNNTNNFKLSLYDIAHIFRKVLR